MYHNHTVTLSRSFNSLWLAMKHFLSFICEITTLSSALPWSRCCRQLRETSETSAPSPYRRRRAFQGTAGMVDADIFRWPLLWVLLTSYLLHQNVVVWLHWQEGTESCTACITFRKTVSFIRLVIHPSVLVRSKTFELNEYKWTKPLNQNQHAPLTDCLRLLYHRNNFASFDIFHWYIYANASGLTNCMPPLLPRPRCTILSSPVLSFILSTSLIQDFTTNLNHS